MATTIKLKNSVTTTAAPSSLVQGEVATNITDKKVWVGDASSTPVQILGAGAPVSGTTGTFTGNTTVAGTFAANGGATLGDASGDALTINSSAVSIPNGLNFDSNTLVIDANNNNLGSGIATPACVLHINETETSGTDRDIVRFSTTSGGVINFICSDLSSATPTWTLQTGTSEPLAFKQGTSERMRIDSSGNVGIGTTSPAGKLVVSSGSSGTTVNAQADDFIVDSSSDVGISILSPDANVSRLVFGSPSDSLAAQVNWDYTNKSLYVGTATATGKLLLITGNAATAATLDSSGNLGLGVTPSAWLGGFKAFDIGSGGAIASSSGTNVRMFQNAYYDGTNYIYKTTNSAGRYDIGAGIHSWYNAASGTAGNAITFTQAMTLDASGNLLVGKTSATANGGDVQVSKGITFPATQSAQSDANTLDDYEEGTFTPTVIGTTTAGTGTYSVQVGRYTKIGDRVFFNLKVIWSAHTGTGNIRFSGLPFTSNSTTQNAPDLAINASTLTFSNQLSAYVVENTTAVSLNTFATGATNSAVAMDTAASVSVSGHYQAA